MLQASDGSALLLGTIHRATDVQSFDERDTQKMVADFAAQNAMGSVSFSQRWLSDALLIWLDKAHGEASRTVLRAGSDLWLVGGFVARGQTWLYGSLGNQAALVELVSTGGT